MQLPSFSDVGLHYIEAGPGADAARQVADGVGEVALGLLDHDGVAGHCVLPG